MIALFYIQKSQMKKVGYHDDRVKQYRRHLTMDDDQYQKTIDGVLSCILETNPNISLIETSYLCSSLEAEVSILLENEQNQAKKTPLANLRA